MGKNRFVYGENTEISYLAKLLEIFAAICLALGIILLALKQWVFSGISLASTVVIIVVIVLTVRRQYQKIDGSFQIEGHIVSISASVMGKRRETATVQYDGETIPVSEWTGKHRTTRLLFILPGERKMEIQIGSLEKGVSIFIEGVMTVQNNYVLSDYLIKEEE